MGRQAQGILVFKIPLRSRRLWEWATSFELNFAFFAKYVTHLARPKILHFIFLFIFPSSHLVINFFSVHFPNSATGTRTRVARVRAEYPNQLDYSGSDYDVTNT